MLSLAGLLLSLLLAPAADAPPADFKLLVELRGAKAEPAATATLVFRHGVAYQFLSDVRKEVQVIDPGGPTITLINLERRVQTQIAPVELDGNLARLHKAIAAVVRRKEQSTERAERVAADMSRDLIDPKFQSVYDDRTHHLRLTNATVEVVAKGEPESDPRRLAALSSCLTALAKMSSLRDPAAIPPFTQLETLHALITERHLRPTDISILYRLAGPPRKFRWTYNLVPELTDNEREAISRVDSLRVTARFVRYPGYMPQEPR
jgi:hypothetical protein